MGNPVVHWEFYSDHPEKSAAFYKQIFGWGEEVMPGMEYHMMNTGGQGGINGGIMKPPMPMPGGTVLYIDVNDLDVFGKKIVAAGGNLVVEKQDVPGMGSFSLFLDPDGRMMGIWKAA